MTIDRDGLACSGTLSRCQDQYYSTRKSRVKDGFRSICGQNPETDQVKGKPSNMCWIGEERSCNSLKTQERPQSPQYTRIRRQDPCSNFSDCDRPNWLTRNYNSHVTTRSYPCSMMVDHSDKDVESMKRRNFAVKRPWESPEKACCSDRYWLTGQDNRERRRT